MELSGQGSSTFPWLATYYTGKTNVEESSPTLDKGLFTVILDGTVAATVAMKQETIQIGDIPE